MSHGAVFLPSVAMVAILAGAPATSPQPADALAGSYRVTLAAGDLVRTGAPSLGSTDDTGTWTLTFIGQRWVLRQEHAPDQNAVDRGVLVRGGNRVGFTLLTSDGAPHRVFLGSFSWRVRDGTLRFTLLANQFPTSVSSVLVARPWKRAR